ncbi:PD-(D/E)XK nuclease family protein, partial [Burkholderia thailandensis]|uniref:RecB family exonuclease n=1 Tax=Burkholderia thailandensis TaxID=57975 RepID=UPI00217D094B
MYLSPSHVGELLDCPRRWFLSRRLGASGTMSAKAQAGSLVHRIAEENAEHWSLDRAMDQLDAEWATICFDYEWESRAVLENCREGLRRLDGWLMQSSHRELVGTEVPVTHVFDLPSAVVHISGSIDRLERDEAGNHIVIDYKTGTKLPG